MRHPARPVWLLLLLLLLLAVAAGSALGAQPRDRRDQPAGTLSELVEVQLVNVEVWVSRGNEPVEGLTADDFVVREDGKPVEITHFAEVRGPRFPVVARDAGRSSGVAEVVRDEPGSAASASPSHLVIYLDELHLSPASRKRPIEDLRALVRSGAIETERVLILNQGRDLYTAAAFGSTAKELDRALERLQSSPGLGTSSASDKRLALQRLQQMWKDAQENARTGSPCDLYVRRAVPEVEQISREHARRVSLTLDHLAGAVRYLAALDGVKTLLYLSDSLETKPASDLLRFVEGVCPLVDRHERWGAVTEDVGVQLHELTRHANANRVTVHALQTTGLQTGFLGMAEQTAFDIRGGGPFELAHRSTERDGLAMLADETGGRAIFNRARFGPELETIAREMSSYYTLAYQPTHGGDGLLHRIDVEVRGGRYQVRHRRGYRDKDSDERLTEKLEGAVYLGLVDNPLGVRLAAGTVGSAARDRHAVPLHVLVPSESLAFLPHEGGPRARVTVVVSVRHQDQRGLETTRRTVDVAAGSTPADTVAISAALELAPGVSIVGVAVRDEVTREASFVATTLELPAVSGDGPPGGAI
jgi:VWFA-related protein